MKKVLAVLLAVLMTFSVLTVGVAAEDTPTGTVYQYTSAGIPRIKALNGEVAILQAGDVLRFDTVKASKRRVEIRYFPDAASIKVSDIVNTDWKENKVPQYNLDSSKWEIDTKNGQTVSDLLAKSPNYYKSFYTYADIEKNETLEITVTGLNDANAYARDSASVDRGYVPIDFALEGAKFVGWALYSYDKWKATDSKTFVINVYALWERGAAPEKPDEPENPDEPVEPTEPQNPIQKAYAKVMYYLEQAATYIGMVPAALSSLLPNYLNGLIRNWLFGLLGIEA